MARKAPRGNGFTVGNNSVQSYPFCRPDDYMSHSNCIPPKVVTAPEKMVHIRHKMGYAELEHKDMHEAMRHGGAIPNYDPQRHQILNRWHEQYTKRGQSTFCKSKDGIAGA